uniref:Uncharacterized protein n=1 Tax=Arundo donax TaxID=35708 RepID=A0A0A9C442_ARUDO
MLVYKSNQNQVNWWCVLALIFRGIVKFLLYFPAYFQ